MSEEMIRPEIRALIQRGNVTPEETASLRCNSWEWQALVPAMNDDAFLAAMQHALDNCFTTRRRPFTTYNEAVEGLYAPELIRRFREFKEAVEAEHDDQESLYSGATGSDCHVSSNLQTNGRRRKDRSKPGRPHQQLRASKPRRREKLSDVRRCLS